ncbi:MAG: MarR family transcriptional regulator [Euryarchaeota archaeon]|nr:MarR family transcriptional regulator [Euryarchaeota archaeon]
MRALLIGFLLLLLLIPGTQAVELKSYKIVAEIQGDIVKEELLITLQRDASTDLRQGFLSLPPEAEVLGVRDTYGPLSYQVARDTYQRLSFNFSAPPRPGEERLVMIDLRAAGQIKEKEGYREYLLVFTPRQDIPEFEHLLKLPKGAELHAPQGFQASIPAANITSQDGAPILSWRQTLVANRPEVFLVRYRGEESMGWRSLLLPALAFLASLAVGFTVSRLLIFHRKRRLVDSFKILNERERQVLEEIVKNEGIKQYELLERLGYTKSSLSKILDRLEGRGLVKRRKLGKVNRLYPGEELKLPPSNEELK